MPKIKVKETKTVKAEVDEAELARSIHADWEPDEIANFLIDLFDNIQYERAEEVFVRKAIDWGMATRFEKWAVGEIL